MSKNTEENYVQNFYPADAAQCYGCGKLNEHGHQIKSYDEGEFIIARFTPKEYHTAVPGYVYGGLLASLIDCHGTGSAAIAAYKRDGREIGSEPPYRFVTGKLTVNYLKPTPLGPELILKGKIVEVKGRKVITQISLFANDVETVTGEVIAIEIPDSMSIK